MVNVTAVIARLEEEQAHEFASLQQVAEDMGNYVEAAEEANDSQSPVYDAYFTDGESEAIASLTNFSDAEFDALWAIVEASFVTAWTTGRGRKCSVKPKDAFLMTLCVLKHYNTWDKHSLDFGLRPSSFEKMVLRMLALIDVPLHSTLIRPVQIASQRAKNYLFDNYRYALHATDVKFQPAHRPSGRFAELKTYFSNKHKLYGLKLEASVAYPGVCVNMSVHHPGSTSDLTIFLDQAEVHAAMLAKTDEELMREDNGEGSDQYAGSWAVLVDEGYQGAQLFCRAIHPKKKPVGSELTREDIARNECVSSDRVLVENYFGRVSSLWKISRSTYTWSRESFDLVSRINFSLTNFHVSFLPLRRNDGDFYRSVLAKYYAQGEHILQARAINQANYRRRRSARLRAECIGQERTASRMMMRLSLRSELHSQVNLG